MIEIATADVVPLAEFPLRWRFGGHPYGDVPSDTLARIHPLGAARAGTLAALARESYRDGMPAGTTFRSDDQPGVVTSRLRALPPAPADRIVISWNDRTAVATDWEIFVAHWDDFCYPASDDVTVWPLDESWTLWYRHFECFQFTSL
jgi:hypothetical protein